ncbi:MAG TPA: F0F1 ATP synthase subunit alpha [Anaerolineae bacterium]|nr:F0F1 ATP synthase subunit alpha [Anaerolineae bacterium]HQI86415.1 F0F1 ATP synthase subunit alpha [Anaerolineae bacterium]
MTEQQSWPRQDAQPDVRNLLRILHERVPHMNADVRRYRAGDTTIIKRLSEEAAAIAGTAAIKPEIPRLMQLLTERATTVEARVRFQAVGTVQRIGSGVATLSGLPRSGTDELVTFPTGVQGLILNLERNHVDVILLGSDEGIQGGDQVLATDERLQVPVGRNLLGRIVNPLGQPLDERGPIESAYYTYLERDAPGIVEREPVNEPLLTGWKMVDALVPIGRGQRELIIGDRQTGKTSLAVDTILNQKHTGVACFYVAIGQKKSSTLAVIETLQKAGALSYTTVIVSSPDDPPALRYLAPYAGCTMAEGVMREGHDVLVVYDDLTRHADAYRELSLLLRRPPGREAYPGDIFYLHSRLLERACKLNAAAGGHSLTALPIVETQRGNMSAYIPTNLISITDGQIVLDSDLFNRGVKPAIDPGRSVSRVGGAAQAPAMRALASTLRLELAQFEEVARFARFGTDVDEATQRQIRRGERLQQLLTQSVHRPLALAAQIIMLAAAAEGYLDDVPAAEVPAFEQALLAHFAVEYPALCGRPGRSLEFLDDVRVALAQTTDDFRATWFRRSSGV